MAVQGFLSAPIAMGLLTGRIMRSGPDRFGVGSYATNMEIASVFVTGGTTAGPMVASALADAAGTYV